MTCHKGPKLPDLRPQMTEYGSFKVLPKTQIGRPLFSFGENPQETRSQGEGTNVLLAGTARIRISSLEVTSVFFGFSMSASMSSWRVWAGLGIIAAVGL